MGDTKYDSDPIDQERLLGVIRTMNLQLTHLELAYVLGKYQLSNKASLTSSLVILVRYLLQRVDLSDLILDMPDVHDVYNKVNSILIKPSFEPKWRELLIDSSSSNPSLPHSTFGLLFGGGPGIGHSWLENGTLPRETTRRTFWFLLKDIESDGDEALNVYLNVLDAHAVSEGFSNGLQEVIKRRSWKSCVKDSK